VQHYVSFLKKLATFFENVANTKEGSSRSAAVGQSEAREADSMYLYVVAGSYGCLADVWAGRATR
jgi:hypothetical protein